MKPDPSAIHRFLGETHHCAIQMMENSSYILKELPALRMPDALRHQLETLCTDLIGTKHDLIHEIHEVHELTMTSPDASTIRDGVKRMCQWIDEANMQFNDGVDAARQAADAGEADGLLSLLLMESGVNILNATPTRPDFELDADTDEDGEEEDAAEAEDWEDEQDRDDPDCYDFHVEDSYPIGMLNDSISQLMYRPDLQPESREKLKVFAFAMERLPLVTPGVRMSLGLRLEQGGESDWIEIRMEDGEFSLGRGSWIDGDASTETVFEVSSGYREGDAFMATHFAESFAECANDVCREVVIEDSSDEPFADWDLAPGESRWGSLSSDFV